MKAADVLALLHERYRAPEWEAAEEVGDATGFGKVRAIDFFAIHTWPSRGFQSVGVEVKVDRGDWLRELKQPHKRALFEESVQEFYFAAPAGVIKRAEVPEGLGLLQVTESEKSGRSLRCAVQPKFYRDRRPDEHLWLAFARALGKKHRDVLAGAEKFAELRGKPISLAQLRRFALKIGASYAVGPTEEKAREARFEAQQSRMEWKSSWTRAIRELARLARADGVDVESWDALGDPKAASAIEDWLRSKSGGIGVTQKLRELVRVVDKELRPMLDDPPRFRAPRSKRTPHRGEGSP